MKFKVGDRVKTIKSGYGIHPDDVGKYTVITGTAPGNRYTFNTRPLENAFSNSTATERSFELVPVDEFGDHKVGDYVVVIESHSTNYAEVGFIGKIKNIDSDHVKIPWNLEVYDTDKKIQSSWVKKVRRANDHEVELFVRYQQSNPKSVKTKHKGIDLKSGYWYKNPFEGIDDHDACPHIGYIKIEKTEPGYDGQILYYFELIREGKYTKVNQLSYIANKEFVSGLEPVSNWEFGEIQKLRERTYEHVKGYKPKEIPTDIVVPSYGKAPTYSESATPITGAIVIRGRNPIKDEIQMIKVKER